ncbi:MAG: SDR family NAD(P)-dependent oxidoreductase [Solirubrobacteraceae bacterium]|nr:SDR family NAD(P)-dependent oxidoreductase [Solirubrobacteraceae bacterium]
MTSAQHPIGSGFGAKSTAAEVLHGIDLGGKLAIVTGGYSGLGLEITRALTGAGAHVVVPARRPATAHEMVDDMGSVEVAELDLADQVSIAAFAEQFLASGRSIDMLIGNAGVMASPERHVDVNGASVELQLATNHFGHYALANRLWTALAADGGARVVSVSSLGHRRSPIRWDDPDFTTGYDKWVAYGQAKTANVLFAVQLDKLGADSGVRAFALHPGGILTPLQRHIPIEEQVALGWRNEDGSPKPNDAFKSPEQGAATATWAATSPQLDGLGGLYLEDVDVAEIVPTDSDAPRGVRPHALDPDDAARLWAWSAEVTGVDAFAASAR